LLPVARFVISAEATAQAEAHNVGAKKLELGAEAEMYVLNLVIRLIQDWFSEIETDRAKR
jgi:hypothetical protein